MKNKTIDELIYAAVFSPDVSEQKQARDIIYQKARENNIFPSSLHHLYRAFGKEEVSGFTVPAFNIRTLTYDTAIALFSIAKSKNIGAFVFEIARSEIGYTAQRPKEYTVAILAGALKARWEGPVFIQGDHYQFKALGYRENPEEEIQKIKDLIRESIDAHFYNIDIDASTLVDLKKELLDDQQKENYQMTTLMTAYIRSIQPDDMMVSIGGEIGHIGGKNSTVDDFTAFMDGYQKLLGEKNLEEISKVSVQTGTSHGGIPLADGTIAEVKLDFSVLKNIGETARISYNMGGAVQHGASTLPAELFSEFVKAGTLEIHLATGFQNIVYDHMPLFLKKSLYEWVRKNTIDEWKDSLTEEQNIYKMRKKALGPFKEKLWKLTHHEKKPIIDALTAQFEFLFEKLQVLNTRDVVKKYAKQHSDVD